MRKIFELILSRIKNFNKLKIIIIILYENSGKYLHERFDRKMGTRVFINSTDPISENFFGESVKICVSCKCEYKADGKIENFVLATFLLPDEKIAAILFSIVVESSAGDHIISRNFEKEIYREKFFGLQTLPLPEKDELNVKILKRKFQFE